MKNVIAKRNFAYKQKLVKTGEELKMHESEIEGAFKNMVVVVEAKTKKLKNTKNKKIKNYKNK